MSVGRKPLINIEVDVGHTKTPVRGVFDFYGLLITL
jgi:hypothetical protein